MQVRSSSSAKRRTGKADDGVLMKHGCVTAITVICLFLCSTVSLGDETEGKTSPFNLPDNDVYLYTPGLIKVVERYRAGEHFEPLYEFERELERNPHLPSTHFWVGGRKLTLALMYRREEKYDEDIKRHFKNCLLRAERMKKLKKLRHAGIFHEALCNGGLGVLHSIRKDYAWGGLYLRKSISLFFELTEERPNHHGALLAIGTYNYYTSRMGTLGKILLRLIMLPVGSRELGLEQLYRAAESGTPSDVLGKMILAPALANYEQKPDEAIAISEEMVRLIPKNSAAHLTFAIHCLNAGRLKRAREAVAAARRTQPAKAIDSALPEFRFRAYLINVVSAAVETLLERDEESLELLYRYIKQRRKTPARVSLMAAFYTAHIFKLGGYDEKAEEMYERVTDGEGARELRDRAEGFLEKKDINDQIRLGVKEKKALRDWLADRPLPE